MCALCKGKGEMRQEGKHFSDEQECGTKSRGEGQSLRSARSLQRPQSHALLQNRLLHRIDREANGVGLGTVLEMCEQADRVLVSCNKTVVAQS